MKTIEGLHGIKATVLANSISPTGQELITFEIEYPRIILAELNTHKMLSKSSHSSRAIPFNKMVNQLTGRPVRFGAANPGMQDTGVDFEAEVQGSWGEMKVEPALAWDDAKELAKRMAKNFFIAGYHKQVYNRLTEPFQMMRTVISGTEWANFFWLRNHEAADPTLHELARVMYAAMTSSVPQLLYPGEWHLPYVETQRGMFPEDEGTLYYFIRDGEDLGTYLKLEDAIKVSAARCAAVSFRNEDYTLEKSLQVCEKLTGDDRKHGSAFEHQGTPITPERGRWSLREGGVINIANFPSTWQEGISHVDRERNLWSGNFKGFVQYRKLIPGENYTGETQ